MTIDEQKAFVKAYSNNVAMVKDSDVAEFVRRYAQGEDLEYSHDYTSIMDALGMWNAAILWQMQQAHLALTLARSELNRHARDTESGELAFEAVEKALKGKL